MQPLLSLPHSHSPAAAGSEVVIDSGVIASSQDDAVLSEQVALVLQTLASMNDSLVKAAALPLVLHIVNTIQWEGLV